MRKINEIFYSLQGEGFHVGTPALFIRFSGCNLHCDFCDTKHTEGEYMDDEEILLHVRQCPAKTVILTGGEPSLSIDSNLCYTKKVNLYALKQMARINYQKTLTGLHVHPKKILLLNCKKLMK